MKQKNKNNYQGMGLLLLTAMFLSCGGRSTPKQVSSAKAVVVQASVAPLNDKYQISGEQYIPPMFASAADVEKRCAKRISEATILRDAVVQSAGDSGESTLERMTELDLTLDRLSPFVSLMANVHPEKEVRDAAEKCEQDVAAFVTELSLDPEVFLALNRIDESAESALAQRSLEKLLRSYRRSGVDKDAETRAEIAEIQQQLVKTGIEFSREIREGTLYVDFTEAQLSGLPKDFIDAHPKTEDGKIRISTDYPDFFPVVNYAESDAVRKDLYHAFLKRAWPANEKNLKDMLTLRAQLAQILGYHNWADYAAETEMAHDSATIAAFIDQVADIARPRMERDLADILKRKQQDDPNATEVDTWDRFYYVNKIKEERFQLNPEELRAYFPFSSVLDGVLDINQQIFGVRFAPVPDAPVWHSDVVAYDVFEDSQKIGRFYLDMHPREGKYKHMAMFHMLEGISGYQLPIGALVCNFPQPDDESVALMEHSDVVTLFHEFGHLMHHILAGGYAYPNLTGISCESEFVEVPSQLLEEWAYDYSVLKTFTRHAETGESIPKELVDKLRAAEEFGKGVHVMRQMFYAGMSLQFHVIPPEDLNLLENTKVLQREYSPYPYMDDTYVYASFGHLTGYSSEYYSYMWSLKLAKDLLTRFQKEGMLNPATAADYRDMVIRKGSSVDAKDMVEQFLGRATTFDAFREYLEN
ncbi:MAG: Zn-dependent oligopeptidase [Deltaproteobacteria bacterium]|nr:Zn-dependent oligopeptidase [Deltaproteobacteria bacterium]MBN2674167.1 Zn-dependent oligopeptidase [Deltaproteobacteria bacterium]